MAAEDKNWAKGYVIDPLIEPDPSDETGLNTHFRSTFAPANPQQATSKQTPPNPGSPVSIGSRNPFRNSADLSKDGGSIRTRPRGSSEVNRRPVASNTPSPPASARLQKSRSPNSPYRQEAFSAYANDQPRTGESPRVRSRGNSLNQGPLEAAKYEHKLAHRSPHLNKRHIPGADQIDRLDEGPAGKYHHEGPFDAALLARNSSFQSSPIAAVRDSNSEALRATPRENIRDSLEHHRPLDGTAIVPPGSQDQFGRSYDYQEGDNMMITNGGDYKRSPGIKYHPDDIKGKGEPSYSIEKALKEHKAHGDREGNDYSASGGASGFELQERRHSGQQNQADFQDDSSVNRSTSHSHKRHSSGLDGLKKRFGSLRVKKDQPVA